jgi:manganese transport protein
MAESGRKSLSEVNESVETGGRTSRFRRLLAFLGPAYLISVGYMDPGNWATDIAGGSAFGYKLLWILLMSNLIALLLQSFSARLGIVRRLDLAQASRETYPKAVNRVLWFLAEIAIAACDLAEVLGMAIGLKLIFGLPILWGVCLTALDSFLLIFLLNYGVRKMEAFIIGLVAIIGVAFLIQLLIAQPDAAEVFTGFIPTELNSQALYLAIGIIGATVMPHNLYLHSSLVQTRRFDRTPSAIAKAIKYNIIDSAIALNAAFFVNAAILILAASTFYNNGLFEIASIEEAHKMLSPLLGSNLAPTLFGVALIAAGQSSTITGTLAGQIIMEGYLDLRIQPWIRRLITRLVAIVPAIITIVYFGEDHTDNLLVFSQVVLSLQLGFAIIPLIHFVSDKKQMGDFAVKGITVIAGWVSAAVIVGLNLNLVLSMYVDWVETSENKWLLILLVGPVILFFIGLLAYIIILPIKNRRRFNQFASHKSELVLTGEVDKASYKKIAITIDFSSSDNATINAAVAQGGKDAEYLLIHIVESAGAFIFGKDVADHESQSDKEHLKQYRETLSAQGYKAEIKLGYGNPKKVIPQLVNEYAPDLLVMGAHGHNTFKDLIFGTTLNTVRHRVSAPLLIVNAI